MAEETDSTKDKDASTILIAANADVRMDSDIVTDAGKDTGTEMNHTDPDTSPQETAHAGLSLWRQFTAYIKRLFHHLID